MKKDIAFVLVQFILFALYIADFNFIEYSMDLPVWFEIVLLTLCVLAASIIITAIVNLNVNLTPFPTPRKNSNLITRGIYGYIRHPIYTGILLFLGALGIYTGSLGRIALTIVLFFVFYYKSEYEEQLLITKFPGYKTYRKVAGRFFPIIRRNSIS